MIERTSILVVDDVVVRIAVAGHLDRTAAFRFPRLPMPRRLIAILSELSLPVDAVLCDVELPGEINGFSLKQWAVGSET